ncbi:MAG TPA: hypothetical protein VFR24_26720 [Candidatus Angelobacter sp.]|nr:hypothetical protein [Candidatus Angelobacter sp.]
MATSKYLMSFEPGFYFDGETVYVDIAEFIRTHNIDDNPELCDVIWSESQRVFSGIPIQRLSGSSFTTKETASAPLGAALSGPRFWRLLQKSAYDA